VSQINTGTAAHPLIEVLSFLAGPNAGEADLERTRFIMASPDFPWSAFCAAAKYHGVLPLVCKNVSALCSDLIPESVSKELKRANLRGKKRRIILLGQFFEINRLLTAHGIRAMMFKGPVLAQLAYPDPMLRQYNDIDFCIDRTDVDRTRRLLMENGYQPVSKNAAKMPTTALLLKLGPPMLTMRNATTDTAELDVHWEIQPSQFLSISRDQLWQNQTTIEIAGQTVSTVTPELHLIVVCAHASEGRWRRLVWIHDVRNLVGSGQLQWTKLVSLARQLRASRMVALGLILVQRLMPSSAIVIEGFESDPELERVADLIVADLSLLTMWDDYTRLKYWKFWASLKQSPLDKILVPLHTLFSPQIDDWERLPLPTSFAGLYYVLHAWTQLKACFSRPEN
jgi:hypothetical protein